MLPNFWVLSRFSSFLGNIGSEKALWLPMHFSVKSNFWKVSMKGAIAKIELLLCFQSTHQQLSESCRLGKIIGLAQQYTIVLIQLPLSPSTQRNIYLYNSSYVIYASHSLLVWQCTATYTHSSYFFMKCSRQLLCHCSFPRKLVDTWAVTFIKAIA